MSDDWPDITVKPFGLGASYASTFRGGEYYSAVAWGVSRAVTKVRLNVERGRYDNWRDKSRTIIVRVEP